MHYIIPVKKIVEGDRVIDYQIRIVDPQEGYIVVESCSDAVFAYRLCNYLNGGEGNMPDWLKSNLL